MTTLQKNVAICASNSTSANNYGILKAGNGGNGARGREGAPGKDSTNGKAPTAGGLGGAGGAAGKGGKVDGKIIEDTDGQAGTAGNSGWGGLDFKQYYNGGEKETGCRTPPHRSEGGILTLCDNISLSTGLLVKSEIRSNRAFIGDPGCVTAFDDDKKAVIRVNRNNTGGGTYENRYIGIFDSEDKSYRVYYNLFIRGYVHDAALTYEIDYGGNANRRYELTMYVIPSITEANSPVISEWK